MSQLNRQTPLLSDTNPILPSPRAPQRPSLAEFSGGATAEFAAVCCCCPFTIINLLYLAVYKVPVGVCRNAWAKTKERQRSMNNKKKQGVLLEQRPIGPIGLTREDLEMEVKRVKEGAKEEGKLSNGGGNTNTNEDDEASKTVDLLEKEMWCQFNETGFFRSQSQREIIKRKGK